MPLFINTNISSLNAQRQLNKSGMQMDQAMERLSSGMRINSASDDAAGLAISNRQTAQIRGLDQAVRNANDGISLIQTAEGALSESTNILQRMRELAVQSSNGIYSDADRSTLDAEAQQLIQELDRIATSTAFNGQSILDGSLGDIDLQVGALANQTISVNIGAVDASTLGMGSLSSDVVGDKLSIVASATGLLNASLGEQDVLINGQAIGAVSTGSNVQELLDNVNENVNGVTATTVSELNMTSAGTGVVGSSGVTVTVRGNDGNAFTFNVANTDTLTEFSDAVSSASGGRASASIDSDGKLSLSAQDSSVLSVAGTDVAALGGSTASIAKLVFTSDNDDPITIERGATGTLSDLNSLGFREVSDPGSIESVGLVASANGANESLTAGELTINGVQIDDDDTDSLTGKIAAINDVTDQTGVTAVAYAQVSIDVSGFNAEANADQLTLNGVDLDLAITSSNTTEDLVTKFNAETDETGVTARLSGNRIILESDQGAINITNHDSAGTAFFGSASGIEDVTRAYVGADSNSTFTESSRSIGVGSSFTGLAGLKLTSENGNPISIELKDGFDASRLGLRESNTLGEGSFGTSLSSVSIGTQSNAQSAIGVIDNALETVNTIRSDLGAANNRLDFTISNLSNVSENTSAARARITDADFASETANLSRTQVLQQASQAMLAQANARPQQVLSLLQ